MSEEPLCRICQEGKIPNTELLQPCLCKGHLKFVHRSCLDQWRATRTSDSFHRCEICLYQYEILPVEENEHSARAEQWRKFCYYALLTRDAFLFFGVFQAILSTLTVFLYACRVNSSLWVCYGYAHIVFFAAIGLVGLMISFLTSNSSSGCYCFSCDMDRCTWIDVVLQVGVLCLVGLFLGFYFAVVYFHEKQIQHRQRLWKQQETKRYVVSNRTNDIELEVIDLD